MKYQSVIETRGFVQFPEFMAERVYMREFYKDKGLPDDLCRWQDTVDAMLDGVDTDGPIYLMIDEGIVAPGTTHRRKGLHIDGYWNPGLRAHGNGHLPSPGGHRPIGHRPVYDGRHDGVRRHVSGPTSWDQAEFKEPEAIILASSLSAARGYAGEFEGPIGDGGDCDLIDLSGLSIVPMDADRVYACNVTGLHRSMPVSVECKRQLVRLNVPGWSPTVANSGWSPNG